MEVKQYTKTAINIPETHWSVLGSTEDGKTVTVQVLHLSTDSARIVIPLKHVADLIRALQETLEVLSEI